MSRSRNVSGRLTVVSDRIVTGPLGRPGESFCNIPMPGLAVSGVEMHLAHLPGTQPRRVQWARTSGGGGPERRGR